MLNNIIIKLVCKIVWVKKIKTRVFLKIKEKAVDKKKYLYIDTKLKWTTASINTVVARSLVYESC